MIPKSGYRFPACAKPRHRFVVSFDASAGEGRSEKILLKQYRPRMEFSALKHDPKSGYRFALIG
jgi:hypothetical protein